MIEIAIFSLIRPMDQSHQTRLEDAVVLRSYEYLLALGKAEALPEELESGDFGKLRNLAKNSGFWSERRWKKLYQTLEHEELEVLIKGFVLFETEYYHVPGRTSISPPIFMCARLRELSCERWKELEEWMRENTIPIDYLHPRVATRNAFA